MVFPFAVKVYLWQSNIAVTASNRFACVVAQSSLTASRVSTSRSPEGSSDRSVRAISTVGMMAWWSVTLLSSVSKGHIVTQPQDQGSGGCLHVLRQILAVRSRIGCQLLFIERLHIIKGLLSRIAINTVTFPLQSCKVIKAGRLYGFYLLFHRTHKSGVVVTVHTDFFSLGAFRHFFEAVKPPQVISGT